MLRQSEDDGSIALICGDRPVPVLGQSYNCERESNIVWVVFRFDHKHRSRCIGEMFRGKTTPRLSQIKLSSDSVIKFPLRLGICAIDKA